MPKTSPLGLDVTARALPEWPSRELRDEAAALRTLLLELRTDLPAQRGPGQEPNQGRYAEALATLGELAISTTDLGPLVGEACCLVAEALAVDAVALLEPDAMPGVLTVRAACGCLVEARGERLACGEGTQAGFALATRGATATADARAAWMDDVFLARHDLVAAALTLLPGLGTPRALLGAYSRQRRAFAPDEVRFLDAAAGMLSAAMARCRAVAEREQLHARLSLADRMISVGTLAAGVAHELNNPLSYVTANLTFLSEQVKHLSGLISEESRRNGEVADLVQQVLDALSDTRDGAERMRVIVRDMRALSRVGDDKIGPVVLESVLESCVTVAWNEIKHRARLVKELAPLPEVRGNQGRLGQVFLNLLINAAQAIPEGADDRNEIRLVTRQVGPDRVAVEVQDTGVGIQPEHLPYIFDPFFTTKPPGIGTGLGLAICHGIVDALGGEIQVESAPGKGSTFRVLLPVAECADHVDEGERRMAQGMSTAAPAAGTLAVPAATTEQATPAPADATAGTATTAATAPSPAPATARHRVLVVDDEPLVRSVVTRTLGREHEIVAVGSAAEALARLECGERYDMILSDLQMPEQSGMDLHAELARRHPELARRMIFFSGGAYTEEARAFLDREGVECLEKPFDLELLRRVVRARLPR